MLDPMLFHHRMRTLSWLLNSKEEDLIMSGYERFDAKRDTLRFFHNFLAPFKMSKRDIFTCLKKNFSFYLKIL